MDKVKDSATITRIKDGERDLEEGKGKRDHLYEVLAALPLEERIEMIARMADRMGV